MLLTSFSGKNQTVFFQASDFFTKSISYVNLIPTCLSWLWRHVACNDLYPFRQTGSLLRALHNNWNECSKMLPLRLSLYGYVVVVIFIEINQKDDRSQCIPVKFDRVCRAKKYAARSVFCAVAFCYFLVRFTVVAGCSSSLTMLPLTTILDVRRFRWKPTIWGKTHDENDVRRNGP